jgi:Protein of unknown function (DUF3187)
MAHSYAARWRRMATFIAIVLTAPWAAAQEVGGLPSVEPLNPVARSRTGLYFQSYVPASRGWRTSISLDYGSVIEYNEGVHGIYLLDAEVSQADLSVGRDLGRDYFVSASAGIGSAASGFLDGFLDWYHGVLGVRMPEREGRPHDLFAYRIELDSGKVMTGSPGTQLHDLRLTIGRRHNASLQTVLSATVPTGSGGPGYDRGIISLGLITTMRKSLSGRLAFEGSLGLGFTPATGEFSNLEREWFAAVTSGLRFRILGNQSLYANFLQHSPYYDGTGYPALDRRELSLNYGWIIRTAGGTEWKIGMTEDLAPTGPAIDVVFQISVSTR